MISVAELLHGTDEDFVTNAYLAALGRWPDEGGFAHHLASIAGQPGRRAEMLRVMHESEEGRMKRRVITPDAGPVPLEQALAAQLCLRTEVLRAEIAELRASPAAALSPALEGEVVALRAALGSLGTELRERIAALEAALAGRVPAAPNLSPAVSLDYVNDVIEAAQAQLNQRLRAIEKRLIAPDQT